jgi:acetyl esterase/lipase
MKKVLCLCLIIFTLQVSSATKKITDIEFAQVDNQSLKLDLYLPEKATTKTPLIVWIHGGGWHAGNKSNCAIKWMTEYGYAIASISYRLTDVAIFPAQIHDCKGAIRWLVAHADKYGFDTTKIAVSGSSAGGQLAALVGTSGDDSFTEGTVGGNTKFSSRVHAVIDFYGATDFILRSKTQPHRANKEGSVVYKLLGGGADKKIDLAKKASAVYYVTKDDPPFLILHGDKDNIVLIDQSQAIHKAYQQAALSSSFIVVKGAGHGGKEFFYPKNKEIMIKFLQENLK